ncbi:MAG: FKBP-type peptidyl-prolyl cis-trans isomerase [Planctomycetota bacterium]|jgi:peptidylprolyl isomerase
MTAAKQGDSVKVHYTGKLDDGTVFDSSEGKDPLEFKIGEHQVIPGFEDGVVGMAIDESKTLEIPCEQAYGPTDPARVIEISREQVPPDMDIQPGQVLEMAGPENQSFPVTVVEVGEEKVKLDANHFLAGKDLTFDITLVEIAD